jgi:UPF0755 protein
MEILKNKKAIFFVAVTVLVIGFLFYFRSQVYSSHGSVQTDKIFEIKKGEGNAEIASRLQSEGIVSGKIYFYYYLRTHNLADRILPGNYQLSGRLTIPEIAVVLTEQKNEFVKVTFPEGWTTKQMAERLTANGLPGEDFLSVAKNPPVELVGKFYFLAGLPKDKGLEGYLFPDTYFFSKEATGNGIVQKMLNTFGERISPAIIQEAKDKGRSLFEIVTMASILEGEVRTEADRKIVSGLFWNRIKNEQALQSCATIAYVLGQKKEQYSFDDTRVASPYNTYLNKGLIPGPISNPGLVSILAALRPTETQFNYFLSDPETGQTIFSKTLDEHNANKVKYGL